MSILNLRKGKKWRLIPPEKKSERELSDEVANVRCDASSEDKVGRYLICSTSLLGFNV